MKAIIVGCGYIARTHIEAIRALGHEVSWVVGRDPERTRSFAEELDIPEWTVDLNEALGSDANAAVKDCIVHICTPPYNHAVIIRKCLAAGKHIICEKPLCTDPVEAETLAYEAKQAYEERGIFTALCCNVRYYPANIEAAGMLRGEGIDKDRLAKVFNGTYFQDFHIPPHPDGWRFNDELSEGMRAVSEIGTHWIDLAYAWTGLKITEVFADLRNWYPVRYRKDDMLTLENDGEPIKIKSEDTAAVLLRFENGGIGTLLLSETAPGHPNDLAIEVSDLNTSYKWEESSPDTLWISADGKMIPVKHDRAERPATFKKLFENVYDAVENDTTPAFPDFDDGMYICKVCRAIADSSKQNEWVPV